MSDGDIRLDTRREARLGFEEAVYCSGKTVRHLNAVIALATRENRRLLLTRLDEDRFLALAPDHRAALDYDPVSRTAFLGDPRPAAGPPRTVVLCAGTSDVPVARETLRTLAWHGQAARELFDVGVAGLWRLLEHLDRLDGMEVAIVAAGMDAALPSVVGGLFRGPVIAVPTSVGYGVADGGRAALHAVLASCAPGVAVMNIDNGYGAAMAALRILHLTTR